jgi:peroxiredoxin
VRIGRRKETTTKVAPIDTGNHAPALTDPIPDADGTPRRIADALRDGPVLLGIYKSSCQASKTIFPILERLHQRDGARGLTVYGISQDSPNVTRSFARRYGITFPLLVEGEAYPVSRAFDIFATPTVYLVRPDGTVASSIMGFFRDQVNEFAATVANELGVPPEPIIAEDETEVPLFVPG